LINFFHQLFRSSFQADFPSTFLELFFVSFGPVFLPHFSSSQLSAIKKVFYLSPKLKTKQKSSTMATLTSIKEAIAALGDKSGSSVQAINKWLESEKQVSISFLDLVKHNKWM